MARYGTKPCTIEAVQFLNTEESIDEIKKFTGGHLIIARDAYRIQMIISIPRQDELTVNVGDFIVKDPETGFAVCRAGAFNRKYELIE